MSEQVQYEDGEWSREMVPTTTLADFLLARIVEDEAAARVIETGVWEDAVDASRRYDHVFRWSPARVVAECEAKRRIVRDFVNALGAPTKEDADEVRETLGSSLRHLALPYADHPDYRQGWAS